MFLRLRTVLTVVIGLSLVLACQGRPPAPTPAPAPAAEPTLGTPASTTEFHGLDAVVVGPWADYPNPKEVEWPTEPLLLERWATASAELACAGRAFLGDPEKQRRASQRILHHHKTTANDVMTYGISLNADPKSALTIGELVAAAAERCR